ncbi:MAG: hypothetical protein JJE50_02020 [Actinomycetales bacterium]|nr:hypothetical protein [Actinomycetales bacterium]
MKVGAAGLPHAAIRPAGHRPAGHRPAALAARLVIALAVLVGVVVLPTTAARAADGDLTAELVDITPTVLRPGQDLVIAGTMTNTTDRPVVDPLIRLAMQRRTPSSRLALDNWLDGSSTSNTVVLTAERLGADVAPGATSPFTVTIPADASRFSEYSTWGPRGIEVQLSGGETYVEVRSVILWFPTDSPLSAPTELSILAPLTPTVAEWSTALEEDRPVGEVAARRVTALLDATADAEVSWALDPALLDLAETTTDQLGTTGAGDATATEEEATGAEQTTGDGAATPGGEDAPGTTGTPSGAEDDGSSDVSPRQELSALLKRMSTESGTRDVVELGYADADIAPLAHQRDFSLARAGAQRGEAILEEAAISVLDGVAWPEVDIDGTTLAALAGSGVQAVVLPAEVLPTAQELIYTPSGRTRVTTDLGPIDAVLWDETLSSALVGEGLSDLEARQLLLAHTAVMARERPSDPRGFLAVLPRNAGADGESLVGLADRLAALEQTPWLDVTNLRSLLGRTDSGETRVGPATTTTDPQALTGSELQSLESDRDALTAFAGITAEPKALVDRYEPALLSTLSSAWRHDVAGRDTLRRDVAAGIGALQDQIQVEAGSTVNLIARSGEIPITIESGLDVDATVTVLLRPQDPRLRVDESVEAVLPAGRLTTVRIPVTAVANGNVDVDVLVLSGPDGEPVAHTSSFGVRVRADWEGTGTAIVAGLLVIGFVLGLVRTIRKGRRFSPDDGGSGPAGRDAPSSVPTPPIPSRRDDG